jgi:hypothetical protein
MCPKVGRRRREKYTLDAAITKIIVYFSWKICHNLPPRQPFFDRYFITADNNSNIHLSVVVSYKYYNKLAAAAAVKHIWTFKKKYRNHYCSVWCENHRRGCLFIFYQKPQLSKGGCRRKSQTDTWNGPSSSCCLLLPRFLKDGAIDASVWLFSPEATGNFIYVFCCAACVVVAFHV